MTSWPPADPSLHPYAAKWYEAIGEVHPRPTPAAAQMAREWAAAFSARIAADLRIPPAMVFEGEEAAGVVDEMRRHPGTVDAHLIYWKVAVESGTSPR